MNINLPHILLITALERKNYNLSHAAKALGLSQPSASRILKEVEESFGQPLIKRNGKRLTGLTPFCTRLMADFQSVENALSNLTRLRQEQSIQEGQTVSIGATPAQAQFFLPQVMQRYRTIWGKVRIRLTEGLPVDILDRLSRGDIDIAICTEAITERPEIISQPCYVWNHYACMPPDHPLASAPLTLEALGQYPLLTYIHGITGRKILDNLFATAGVKMNVLLETPDASLIKKLVSLEQGIGIIGSMSIDHTRDQHLIFRKLPEAPNLQTSFGIRKGRYQTPFARSFQTFLKREGPLFQDRVSLR